MSNGFGKRGTQNSNGGGSPSNNGGGLSLLKRNGTGGPACMMGDYCEVREMDNEESSKSSTNVPEYNDYVMLDKVQRDKLFNQFQQIRLNIDRVKAKAGSDLKARYPGSCQFPKVNHRRKFYLL
jgi:hypothetical protein